jgi:hypothetical protein
MAGKFKMVDFEFSSVFTSGNTVGIKKTQTVSVCTNIVNTLNYKIAKGFSQKIKMAEKNVFFTFFFVSLLID